MFYLCPVLPSATIYTPNHSESASRLARAAFRTIYVAVFVRFAFPHTPAPVNLNRLSCDAMARLRSTTFLYGFFSREQSIQRTPERNPTMSDLLRLRYVFRNNTTPSKDLSPGFGLFHLLLVYLVLFPKKKDFVNLNPTHLLGKFFPVYLNKIILLICLRLLKFTAHDRVWSYLSQTFNEIFFDRLFLLDFHGTSLWANNIIWIF